MALKGNLRDFTFVQLLNLIHLARKTGTLVAEGPNGRILVSFFEGKLAYAQAGHEDNSLTAILFNAGRLSAAQQRAIKERAGRMSDKELGLLLINADYINQKDILTLLQSHYTNIVNPLFTWAEGSFRFEQHILPPPEKITIRMGLENIILEGTRRIREWEQLKEEIPSLDAALRFSERPGLNIRKINLNPDEWRVVSYVNPKNTIRQIARATKHNDLEIRRIVFGLLQAGLVEMIRPQIAPLASQSAAGRTQTKSSKTEQKSLINRIISRIRSL